ncbi:MAG: ribosome small subunit-dependent GTPase A [Clostridia bacterium]|nr:ribosome small subunit-dependent GTPase A [Clostridia bacterium]
MQKDGIIISNASNLYIVEDIKSNEIIKCNARGKFKEQGQTLAVGDYVEYEVVDEEKKEGIIDVVKERKTYIKRPKLANLTQIIFVISMKQPKPDLLMLDKQLAFAELNNIKPIICLNKIDLVSSDLVDDIEKTYADIGYKIFKTNAHEKIGVDDLKDILEGYITAFSGNSGVGKSTLINDIFEDEITKSGLISEKNQRGKNTTTSTYLYKINENTYLADTPGFSTFDISEIASEDLYKYFIEFVEPSKNCEFVGCTHIKEESCGIKDAVTEGKISSERYERFCKIYLDLKEKENRRW